MEEKSYPQMRKEFQEAYFKTIVPKLKDFESERKKLLLKSRVASFVLAIISLFFPIIFTVSSLGTPIFYEFFLLSSFVSLTIVSGIITCMFYYTKKSFEHKVKHNIMPDVCNCFTDLLWCEGKVLEDNLFFDSKLFKGECVSCGFDDVFCGSYKNVKFEIMELYLQTSASKYGFHGAIVKLDLNKNCSGNTVIYPAVLNNYSGLDGLQKIKLEDIKFSQTFDVFSDDEVEARYLITPAFMQRLKNMKVAFNASNFSCAFYDKYLLIGLQTGKDLFSICSLNKPLNDDRQFFTLYEEIISIIKLIDHFKLDRKIGL